MLVDRNWEWVDFESLRGLTFVKIEGLEKYSSRVSFVTDTGITYVMYHEQDCCESVRIIDVVGDVNDLLFSPILFSDESSNSAEDGKNYEDIESGESATWTFYKLATVKGWVDIRWLGTSNGYYSESVSVYKIEGETNA